MGNVAEGEVVLKHSERNFPTAVEVKSPAAKVEGPLPDKPSNDPSLLPPHVESTATASLLS